MKAKMKSRKKGLCVFYFHILLGSTEDAKTPNFSGIIRSTDFAISQLFEFSRNMPKRPLSICTGADSALNSCAHIVNFYNQLQALPFPASMVRISRPLHMFGIFCPLRRAGLVHDQKS
jgi:hypothetical protein